jgi:hypothetical protein
LFERALGTFKTVGDKEHAEVVRLYVKEGVGFNKIAEIIGRPSRIPLSISRSITGLWKEGGFAQRAGD